MTGRLEGRTAVITGASRGIGLAIAERLVADGARGVITARTPSALDDAVDRLGGARVALGVAGKADNLGHQAETVRRAIETFGSVDMLVNNTGINPAFGPIMDLDLGAARKVVEVNCIAALSWAQQVYHAWMKQHGGGIVNVSSVSGIRPEPGIGFYGASKSMLASLTELMALELSPGIRVNAVAPALVRTKFASALFEGREDEVAATYPLKRLGEADDVGSAVAFLLSEDSSWITGQLLVVDGGVTLGSGVG
ncbi:3-ketoacyl-ACP reductase [Amycolatopsis orientalis]|uniref:3-ketoacyl-ACP reductase n=1 Tax=Amycolatopsis orientalis TaxID=31958 RepID=A0A193BUJ7_AMYOR|nr:SDR family oxidoreductase [Amycolatopsis orientalis]ANN15855.1 3-ketoacyl-ACP reductase [Amycolatopsis orientalis]